ncbi:MAG: MFS transporter [Desulfotignum sp.]|nr:MFS transporter [Desulfotignum sp.]MCF8137077.1 MFS transporter [Desulfotignum sp.]
MGPLLGRTGYRPNAAQTASTVLTLKVLYALVPCLCNVLSIAFIRFYPISEKEHARIRSEIEQGSPVRDCPGDTAAERSDSQFRS